MLWAAVAVGGALGSVARLATSMLISRWVPGPYPWGTLAANVAGCFAMGLLATLLLARGDHPHMRAFLLTGFLGGFTTFSSFANETLQLVRHEQPWLALANVALTLGATLVAVWAGFRVSGAA